MCRRTTQAEGRSPTRRPTKAERLANRIERLAGIVGDIFSNCLDAMRHEDDVEYVEDCLAEIFAAADPAAECRRLADEGVGLRGDDR